MQQRPFGNSGLRVSEIGFGCARIGGVFERNTKSDLLKTLRRAFDLGITFFDTADMYTQGESERLLGEAFRRDRDAIVIASKAGYCLPTQKRAIARIKPLLKPLIQRAGIKRENIPSGLKGSITQDFSPRYLTTAVDGSLKRLKTDYLDLFQLHSPPSWVLDDGSFLEPLERLKRQGKIRYYGVSCETTPDAAICLRYPEISSLQIRISLLEQSALTTVVPAAAEKGVAVIARECFAGGMLAKSLGTLHADNITPSRPGQRGIEEYDRIAKMLDRPLSELALQFALSLDGVAVTLLGMYNESQVTDNLRRLISSPLSIDETKLLYEHAVA